MKNLKIIRKRKNKSTEEGFSLVVATGFGLVIMMIGLTIMARTMKDSGVSASQKTINRSYAAAQSGLTQYLSLMNNNRSIANVASTDWESKLTTQTEKNKITGWNNLALGSDTSKGQYKIISYQAPVAGSKQAVLTIEGRVNPKADGTDDESTGKTRLEVILDVSQAIPQGNLPPLCSLTANTDVGSVNTYTQGAESAEYSQGSAGSTLGVTTSNSPVATVFDAINCRLSSSYTTVTTRNENAPSNVAFPALWLKKGTGAIGQDFKATGLVTGALITTGDLSTRNPDLYTYPDYVSQSNKGAQSTAARTSIDMSIFLPAKPTLTNTDIATLLSSGAVTLPRTTDITITSKVQGQTQTVTVPADKFTEKVINGVTTRVYEYPASSITGGKDLIVNTVNSSSSGGIPQKVVIHLDGDIDMRGGGTIQNVCKNLDGTPATNCDVNNFIIYGHNPTNAPRKICTSGGHVIEGFIIAPTYTVGGNASGNFKGAFKGAVWANKWSSSPQECGNDVSNQPMVQQSTGTWGQVTPYLRQNIFTTTITVVSTKVLSNS